MGQNWREGAIQVIGSEGKGSLFDCVLGVKKKKTRPQRHRAGGRIGLGGTPWGKAGGGRINACPFAGTMAGRRVLNSRSSSSLCEAAEILVLMLLV